MTPQQMMEEIDRLARLCEAKDAESDLAKEHERQTVALAEKFYGQLSEAQAQIAMKDDALKAVKAHDDYAGQYSHLPEAQQTLVDSYADALALVCKAISATSETVAAWRAKETEPLSREVAMLRDVLGAAGMWVPIAQIPLHERIYDAIKDSQATALAYEREVKAKALEEFGEKYRCVYLVHRGTEVYVGPELKELADKEAEELRAANKGEVK